MFNPFDEKSNLICPNTLNALQQGEAVVHAILKSLDLVQYTHLSKVPFVRYNLVLKLKKGTYYYIYKFDKIFVFRNICE